MPASARFACRVRSVPNCDSVPLGGLKLGVRPARYLSRPHTEAPPCPATFSAHLLFPLRQGTPARPWERSDRPLRGGFAALRQGAPKGAAATPGRGFCHGDPGHSQVFQRGRWFGRHATVAPARLAPRARPAECTSAPSAPKFGVAFVAGLQDQETPPQGGAPRGLGASTTARASTARPARARPPVQHHANAAMTELAIEIAIDRITGLRSSCEACPREDGEREAALDERGTFRRARLAPRAAGAERPLAGVRPANGRCRA